MDEYRPANDLFAKCNEKAGGVVVRVVEYHQVRLVCVEILCQDLENVVWSSLSISNEIRFAVPSIRVECANNVQSNSEKQPSTKIMSKINPPPLSPPNAVHDVSY